MLGQIVSRKQNNPLQERIFFALSGLSFEINELQTASGMFRINYLASLWEDQKYGVGATTLQ
ncbi:MAG: hypothetical protein AAB389_00455 [Patescibacteria group bacterium]